MTWLEFTQDYDTHICVFLLIIGFAYIRYTRRK
jgi:hypothetical protein